MSKKFKDKVRRRHIDWMYWVRKLHNHEIYASFFDYKCKLYRGKSLSDRRCAYYALKNYYHTTTIEELVDKLDPVPVKSIKSVVIGDMEFPVNGKM